MSIKISLVIPTRDRAKYLTTAIRSAIAAADRSGCPVEIVVCDNASADHTPSVVSGFTDSRVVARRSERRLSMRENFEFALSHATGSHIIFIGDDDAVLPNGLRVLSRLIADNDPDIVRWQVLSYFWPVSSSGLAGSLKLRPNMLSGRLRKIDPKAVLNNFARAEFRTYHDGGMIYHGCISRRLIERAVAATGGPFFRGSSPDVFTSMQSLMVTSEPILAVDLPITLGGASPQSNGATAQAIAESGGTVEGTEFAKFIVESGADPWQGRLPARCQSVTMITLDSLQLAAKLHEVELVIDRQAWSNRVAQEIARYAEPARSDCSTLASSILDLSIDLPVRAASAKVLKRPPSPSSQHQPLSPQPARLQRTSSKMVFSGGANMADAASAAILLDRLTGLETASPAFHRSLADRFSVFRCHLRAGRLVG